MREERIGRATLYQADSLALDLPRVDHLITDPPYEALTQAAIGTVPKGNLKGASKRLGRKLIFDPIDAIRVQVAEMGVLSRGWFIAFCTPEGVARWADTINAGSMKYKRACVWVKPDSTPQFNGQGPASGAEMFVCAWAGSGHAQWNGGGKRGVYTHCVNNPERHGEHPTEKPRRLMAEILADFTNPEQTILDPFMGSGTTGVAAVQMGRNFIGIERDERYFEIACERIDKAQRQADLFIEAAA
jgi:site-specific DNA-methyltransferase (adenine-specific)